MTKNTKIQKVKLFIKASIIVAVLFVFVVLGIFGRPMTTFENSHMKKWLFLDESQKITTIKHVVSGSDNQELLIKCVDKIAGFPDSNEMLIRDAVVICQGGIQMNKDAQSNEE